jgi:hypothetical protein
MQIRVQTDEEGTNRRGEEKSRRERERASERMKDMPRPTNESMNE